MHSHDFGGFSARTCSIDLRFTTADQFEHFVKAWSARGRPDPLPAASDAVDREAVFETISVGTTLEHELRHYHDFLLSYSALHNYWQRTQAIINSTSLIARMINDPDLEYLVFPAADWMATGIAERRTYLADALGDPDALARCWNPPAITGPKPTQLQFEGSKPLSDDTERCLLYALRDQLDTIRDTRNGIVNPDFPFPFTPRFVGEMSSLLVQCSSVASTYGVAEMDFFMNRLAADGSKYTKFFCGMLRLFSGRPFHIPAGEAMMLDTEDVDWRALSAAITWCFCGSSADPILCKPEQRMAALLETMHNSSTSLFPPKLDVVATFHHLDQMFRVVTTAEAARRNTEALRGFQTRGAAKLKAAGSQGISLLPLTELFESLIDERERLVKRFLDDPAGYLIVGRYVRELPQWPQCPVSLNFAPAGMALEKNYLRTLGEEAVFDESILLDGVARSDVAVEVSYPCFLPGGTSFPWKKAKTVSNNIDLFDMFFDPDQVDVTRERQIRQFASLHGKTLIRYV